MCIRDSNENKSNAPPAPSHSTAYRAFRWLRRMASITNTTSRTLAVMATKSSTFMAGSYGRLGRLVQVRRRLVTGHWVTGHVVNRDTTTAVAADRRVTPARPSSVSYTHLRAHET